MSNLANVGIGFFSVAGAIGLANEGMGAFTNADTWYKGRISISNGMKYLLAPTLKKRKELFTKISGIVESFSKEITEEELQRIVASPESEKRHCCTEAMRMLGALNPDLYEGQVNKKDDKEENKEENAGHLIVIANGYVAEREGMCFTVKYGADSISIAVKMSGADNNESTKSIYTMNKDGSLTLEFDSMKVKNLNDDVDEEEDDGDEEKEGKKEKREKWKVTFMPKKAE